VIITAAAITRLPETMRLPQANPDQAQNTAISITLQRDYPTNQRSLSHFADQSEP
jgi:hypothetical protein